ncbi:Beta-2 adrenergic receptor [Mizuhopecten yessoensis]|uniref:Beta-2 adrenergic receptor n=1 Tax=Mizuhopecten yessoensis TaxID=6573 RepID=A0A210PVR9_MIZYE|nr:Beta-2 adrenergic receptor [Mizuhopecten yessoensis]
MDVLHEKYTNETYNETTFNDVNTSFPVVKVALMSMWSIMVLVPNCLVLVVLTVKTNLRKTHRTEFVLWLCISDLMVGLSSVMYLLTHVAGSLATSPRFCALTLHCVYSGVTLSLVHIFFLCYERYLAVVRKIRFQLLNKKMKYILVLGSYLIVSLYTGIMTACFLRADTIEYCGIQSFPKGKYYMISASIVCLPLLVLTVFVYIIFVIKLKKQMRKTYTTAFQLTRNNEAMPNHEAVTVPSEARRVEQTFQQKEREITITIGLIVVALFLLTGPFIVTKFLEGISAVSLRPAIKISITFLAGSNSLFNPILYAWRLPAFRKEVRNIFTKHS